MAVQPAQQRGSAVFSARAVQALQDHMCFLFKFPEHMASDNGPVMLRITCKQLGSLCEFSNNDTVFSG